MKDARIPEETPHEDSPSNTPQPTPVIPQTGDGFPFALLSAVVLGSIVGFGILAYKRRKSKMDEREH